MTNAVVALAVETAVAGHGALVFCSSRMGSEVMALLISDALPTDQVEKATLDRRGDLVASLCALPGGFESSFSKTIPRGVAFHHAGLTIEERELVAGAYDDGVLKVMVATCCLAAGINLPARRVILNGARQAENWLAQLCFDKCEAALVERGKTKSAKRTSAVTKRSRGRGRIT